MKLKKIDLGPREKYTKAEANYRKMNLTHPDRRCGNCAYMNKDGTCDMVKGIVDPYHLCDYWKDPGAMQKQNLRPSRDEGIPSAPTSINDSGEVTIDYDDLENTPGGKYSQVFRMDFVIPRLAISNAPLREADVKTIKGAGINVVVDLRLGDESYNLLTGAGLLDFHNPTPDDGKPKPVDWFKRTWDFAMPLYIRGGEKLLFHCFNGGHRSPSQAFGFMYALGFPEQEIMLLLRNAYAGADPIYMDDAMKAAHKLKYC